MSRRLIITAVLLLTIVGLAPYSTARALQGASGPLETLLGQVPDNEISHTQIWYGSLGDLQQVLGVHIADLNAFRTLSQQQQQAYLLDIGKQVYYSPCLGLDRAGEWEQTFGLNPFAVEREVTVGAAPKWYCILSGSALPDITSKLTALGYTTSQVGSSTVYSLGADNAANPGSPVGKLALANYNRLVVSASQIIAGPSTAMIQAATGGNPIGQSPAYTALVQALEGASTVPDTQLLSAALFDGAYLADKVITADPLAASLGDSANADQLQQLRSQLGLQNEKLLPRYETAGFGYRRSATARTWVIALVYKDANAANTANGILTDRLPRYQSFRQEGRKLFDGWKINGTVTPSANQLQVVLVTLELPAQTDVAWTDLFMNRDIGFLATEH